tara:strand:- start:19 stop:273 length:255 start_codon:yes stop_codon:yes gene_type:complete
MPRKKIKPTLHEMNNTKPLVFAKVLCELGLSGKEEWVDLPLHYDWTPTLDECGSLLSVYLEKPRGEIIVKDRIIVRTPQVDESE